MIAIRSNPTIRRSVRGLLGLLLAAGAPASHEAQGQAAYSPQDTVALCSDLRVHVRRGRDIELEVLPPEGDGYTAIARRLSGKSGQDLEEASRAIAAWNDSEAVSAERWIRVPFALLSNEFRALALVNVYPEDRLDGEDWIHVAMAGAIPTYDEGLWQVAEWFTGRGSHFTQIMEANDLSSPELRAGQRVRVPASLLLQVFRTKLRSDDGELFYDTDGRGPYAGYALKSGEALYSAVVGRFTGRTTAEDVISLADQIGRRSKIRDARDIPVGYVIKIPLDLLEPQFLPAGHPKRLEAEQAEQELARALAEHPVAGAREGLEGVLVVLDPGHGGVDLGTMNNGIWEHDYVYDVTCRLKQKLERETAATVVLTLVDEETGCVPSTSDALAQNRQGSVLTDPRFRASQRGEAKIGVNLRWYLANSIFRKAVAKGQDADKVLFLSLHADARHPSLRGVMVYVPGAGYRSRTYGFNSKFYSKFAEVREKPFVSYSRKSRVRSEAVSRELAQAIVEAFDRRELPIQPHQPVRHRIIRGRQVFVPAVIGGNAIPSKVLVEMVNLTNPADAALLASATQRERLAAGLLDSVFRYFGEKPTRLAAGGGTPGATSAD